MDTQEAIEICKDFVEENKSRPIILHKAIETLINVAENSIPTEVIEEYLKQEQKAFDTYKKESKENENLKLGMWKHLGAKNMCEKILGIEKTVTTLDEDLLENK